MSPSVGRTIAGMAEPMRTPRGGQIDDLEQREFSRARKGYEPSEVRATLVQTAAELRRLRAERGRLSDELAAARAETERVRRQAESAPVVLPDDAELTRVLGEEMVKLLDDARTTAAGIAERAEEAAQGARSAAEAEAAERLEGLDEELAERRAEAEADEREILERANNVLAERLGIAPSTCLMRTQNLVKRGVIRGFRADVDHAKVGAGLQAMVSVRVRPGARGALLEVFPGLPEYGNDGFVYASDRPGLGVDIDEEKAGKYPCDAGVTTWTQTRRSDGSLITP